MSKVIDFMNEHPLVLFGFGLAVTIAIGMTLIVFMAQYYEIVMLGFFISQRGIMGSRGDKCVLASMGFMVYRSWGYVSCCS